MHFICHDPFIQYSILKFAFGYYSVKHYFMCSIINALKCNASQKKGNILVLQPSSLSCCTVMCSHSHELSFERIKQCWRGRMEEQSWVGKPELVKAKQRSAAGQSHDGPGCRACERVQVPLQVTRPSLLPPMSSTPSSTFLPWATSN